MNSLNFWKKISNYSTIVCGIFLIALMFFAKYLENIMLPILFTGSIALAIALVSKLMIFIKRKDDE